MHQRPVTEVHFRNISAPTFLSHGEACRQWLTGVRRRLQGFHIFSRFHLLPTPTCYEACILVPESPPSPLQLSALFYSIREFTLLKACRVCVRKSETKQRWCQFPTNEWSNARAKATAGLPGGMCKAIGMIVCHLQYNSQRRCSLLLNQSIRVKRRARLQNCKWDCF